MSKNGLCSAGCAEGRVRSDRVSAATCSRAVEDETLAAPTESEDRAPHTILVVAFFAVLAVVLAFPHVSRIGRGISGDPGDALLNMWIIRHVQLSVPHGWHALWNAPIFYPADHTLAYSETLFPVALVAWPLRALAGDVVAFNLVYIGSWVLCSWATYQLARRFTRQWPAAVVAALAYTYSTARLSEFGHFQIEAGGGLIALALLAAMWCLDSLSVWRALAFAVAFAAVALTASYDGALGAVVIAIVVAGRLLIERPSLRRVAAPSLVALVAIAGLVGPFAYQYVALQRKAFFRRAFIPSMALHLEDFRTGVADRLPTRLPALGSHLAATPGRHPLFPGIVALVLALFGAVALIRMSRETARERRRSELLLICLAGFVAVVLAFGDRGTVAGHDVALPFSLLREHVPGFSGIRAMYRLAIVGELAVALLAGVGADAILGRARGALRVVTAAALIGLCIAEALGPVGTVDVPTAADDNGFVQLLRAQPPGAVVELPMQDGSQGAARWAFVEAPRQLEALRDGKPRVNGYSGFDPPKFDVAARLFNDFPSAQALREARRFGVRYVVLRTKLIGHTPRQLRAILAQPGVARYSDAAARRMIRRLASDRGRVVAHVPGGYLIELS
jgi:hypothetical protein